MNDVKHTPWCYENVHDCCEQSAHGVVKDDRGKILFDTLNSDVAEIHTEHDEDSVHRWDETGRKNLTLAAAAPDLFACVECAELLDLAPPPNVMSRAWREQTAEKAVRL